MLRMCASLTGKTQAHCEIIRLTTGCQCFIIVVDDDDDEYGSDDHVVLIFLIIVVILAL